MHDVYHDQKVLRDRVVPQELILDNANYRPEMPSLDVPNGIYSHVCGIDIARDQAGQFRVLEDNTRTPSGVSYVVENRHLMLRTFPDLTNGITIRPVSDYGHRLRDAMAEVGLTSP